MSYIRRDLEAKIVRHVQSESDAILLISGARQTGKTTLIENIQLPMEKTILNLWDEEREIISLRHARTFSEFESFLATFFGFRPDGSTILVIDEAQAADSLALFLMEMQRKWKKQKVILLGSILSNLFAGNAPMPTGRTLELVCRPLNFREFLRFRGKENTLDLLSDILDGQLDLDPNIHALLVSEYELFLQIGGLPGIVRAHLGKEDTRLIFESFLANVYRDADRYIYQEEHGRRGRAPQYGSVLEYAMRSIAFHVGQATQNSTILSSDSPAYRTILPKVLEALRSWHLAYFLPFETAQLTTKKGYNSKKYLLDTGMVNFLVNRFLPVRLNDGSEVTAKLLENAVLQELVASASSIGNITSYKTSNRVPNELDYLATIGERVLPIEVKSSAKVNQKSLSQLLAYLSRNNQNRGYVIYTGLPKLTKIENKEIWHLPPYLISQILTMGTEWVSSR